MKQQVSVKYAIRNAIEGIWFWFVVFSVLFSWFCLCVHMFCSRMNFTASQFTTTRLYIGDYYKILCLYPCIVFKIQWIFRYPESQTKRNIQYTYKQEVIHIKTDTTDGTILNIGARNSKRNSNITCTTHRDNQVNSTESDKGTRLYIMCTTEFNAREKNTKPIYQTTPVWWVSFHR